MLKMTFFRDIVWCFREFN